MKRVLLAVGFGLLLTLGLMGSSVATEKASPNAPQSLTATVTGTSSVALVWRVPTGHRLVKPTSYTITWAELTTGRGVGSRVVSASTLSTTLADLQPGISYRARVAASHGRGRGPWAQVDFTVPAGTSHVQGLFAIDTQAHTLVRFPLAGGASTTLLTGVDLPRDLAVDPAGNAYVIDDETVTKVPADGSTPTTIGSGSQVETDDAGNVYIGGVGGVVETTPNGQVSTITTTVSSALVVTGGGTVTATLSSDTTVPDIATYAPGAPPVIRTVNLGGYPRALLSDDAGNLYIGLQITGGSGATSWVRVDAGSTARVGLPTRLAEYAAALAPDGRFYLGQSETWCTAPGEDVGGCVPNRNVAEILVYPPGGGSPTGVPITGLRTSRGLGTELAVDSTGAMYAAMYLPDAALLRYPATGGAPTRLADGRYVRLTVG